MFSWVHAPNTMSCREDVTLLLTLLAECHGSNKAAFGVLYTAGSWSQNTRRTRLFCEDPGGPGTCSRTLGVPGRVRGPWGIRDVFENPGGPVRGGNAARI